jgi:hypothetical protein
VQASVPVFAAKVGWTPIGKDDAGTNAGTRVPIYFLQVALCGRVFYKGQRHPICLVRDHIFAGAIHSVRCLVVWHTFRFPDRNKWERHTAIKRAQTVLESRRRLLHQIPWYCGSL